LWRCHGIVPCKCGCRSGHVAVHPRRSFLLCHGSVVGRLFVATASVRRRYVDCPEWRFIDSRRSFPGRCSTQRTSLCQPNPRSPAERSVNRCAGRCNSLHQCSSRQSLASSCHQSLLSGYGFHLGPLASNQHLNSLWYPRVGSCQECCSQEHDHLDYSGYC
jgi:hypothetical protein